MEMRDVSDRSERRTQEAMERQALERRIQQAEDLRPGTFRYADADLDGEVRTSVAREGGVYNIAQAEVFRRDGSREVVGTARFSVAGGEATLHGDAFTARTYGVESALLSEVGEQARARGADRLRVWAPDGDPTAEQRWSSHGFRPTERNPGAKGAHREKRL